MKKLILALLFLAFSGLASAQQVKYPMADAKTASYTGTAGSTATWVAGPSTVMVFCTTQCHVVVGEGVTATTSDTPLPANVVIWLPVPPGSGNPWRVSAIQASSGGSVYARPFN